MQEYLRRGEGKDLVKQLNATYQLDILKKKGGKPVATWSIDLTKGNGECFEGKSTNPDATFIMADDIFEKVSLG